MTTFPAAMASAIDIPNDSVKESSWKYTQKSTSCKNSSTAISPKPYTVLSSATWLPSFEVNLSTPPRMCVWYFVEEYIRSNSSLVDGHLSQLSRECRPTTGVLSKPGRDGAADGTNPGQVMSSNRPAGTSPCVIDFVPPDSATI